ncbi:MAG: D-2-hydroxyacid dehydrogenase, partial [Pseudomonadota bacterium]
VKYTMDKHDTVKIVCLDKETFSSKTNFIRPSCKHDWHEYTHSQSTQILERSKDADIIITNKVPLKADLLKECPNLKMIAVAATGYNVIDMEYCKANAVTVCNTRQYAPHSLPEHSFALILTLRRQIVAYHRDVINGVWQNHHQFCFHTHTIRDLAGATLGIIGSGSSGRAVAKLATAFGMRVLFSERKNRSHVREGRVPFKQILHESDIISLHCPLSDENKNMIAMDEFKKMQKKPLIINTARGGLVHEKDLVDALEQGLISGAGFDVLTAEPPTDNNPLLQIASKPNVIITPHIAWASIEAQNECWRQTITNIDNYVAGNPTNVIN